MVKVLEKEEEVMLSKKLIEERERDKVVALQKKIALKKGMDNQFAAMNRIKQDANELDTLAQKEGDRRADLFDQTLINK